MDIAPTMKSITSTLFKGYVISNRVPRVQEEGEEGEEGDNTSTMRTAVCLAGHLRFLQLPTLRCGGRLQQEEQQEEEEGR